MAFARSLFHRLGELRDRTFENQIYRASGLNLLVAAIILWNSWGLLRQSVFMFLGAVPEGIETGDVAEYLSAMAGVEAVHDLHIWPMGTRETVLSAHLVMGGHPGNAFLLDAQAQLRQRFGIGHATLQIEIGESPCRDCD